MKHQKQKPELLHPIRDYVKVRVFTPKEVKTESGIIIPQQQRDDVFKGIKFYEAEILEFSPEIEVPLIQESGLKVGDIVLTDVFSGIAIPTTGDVYIKMVQISMLFAKKKNGYQALKETEMEALFERVLVEVGTPQEETTAAGIIIPDQDGKSIFDSLVVTGKILSVAAGVDGIKVGDTICFEKDMGVPVSIPGNNKEYKVLVKYDAICKVDTDFASS